jgi:hypothetical protein
MAYAKGELEFGKITDSRTDDYDMGEWFYLPHSCQDWVIGTAEDARNLMEDLEKFIGKGV